MNEFLRKKVVALKRNTKVIPLLSLLIGFLWYSLNLTTMSNTTAKIQYGGMGLSQFCIMLFSILSLVCMLNAFPHRKKANVPMVVLLFVLLGIILYADSHYLQCVERALKADNGAASKFEASSIQKVQLLMMVKTGIGALIILFIIMLISDICMLPETLRENVSIGLMRVNVVVIEAVMLIGGFWLLGYLQAMIDGE